MQHCCNAYQMDDNGFHGFNHLTTGLRKSGSQVIIIIGLVAGFQTQELNCDILLVIE